MVKYIIVFHGKTDQAKLKELTTMYTDLILRVRVVEKMMRNHPMATNSKFDGILDGLKQEARHLDLISLDMGCK